MILNRYLALKFLRIYFMMFLGFAIFLGFLDLLEQIRRHSGQYSMFDIIQLTLLSTPGKLYQIVPLIAILASVAMFVGLARSSELVVTRAAGRSGLRAVMAPTIAAAVLGIVAVLAMNPIVAATQKQYEATLEELAGPSGATASIADQQLWLRQGSAEIQWVIRAGSANLDGTRLLNVTFHGFDRNGTLTDRVEADFAELGEGNWRLRNAKRWQFQDVQNPEANATRHSVYEIATDLTRDRIRDSFGTPSSIPIWGLPGFIHQLETAGFTARRHIVWFHMELATPAFIAALVILAAGFTMRQTRTQIRGLRELLAVITGFGLFFLRNFAQIMGENGQIAPLLVAWIPPLAALGLSLALLLHTEDG